MQGGVDGGGARIEVEGAVGQVAHHLVLVRHPAIEPLQGQQLVEIEGGEAVQRHGAQIAAGALHPQDRGLRCGERVPGRELGRGVAAAEIGDCQVRAQQVGAIEQQLRRGEAPGHIIGPARGRRQEGQGALARRGFEHGGHMQS